MQFFEKHIQMKAFCFFFCECKLIVNTVMWKRKQWAQAQQQISNRMLKKKRLVVLQWSGQYPDLNLTEMLLQDLRRAVHKPIPANVNELK